LSKSIDSKQCEAFNSLVTNPATFLSVLFKEDIMTAPTVAPEPNGSILSDLCFEVARTYVMDDETRRAFIYFSEFLQKELKAANMARREPVHFWSSTGFSLEERKLLAFRFGEQLGRVGGETTVEVVLAASKREVIMWICQPFGGWRSLTRPALRRQAPAVAG
jgi:hypothetical protein